ncbi:MAG: hypothetical protein A3G49_03010 [Candidatus Sungbacteria bacterium RIFCSPLOWO2_12_FULL_41_11]|uniref:Uncharacterized protein n=1 Tax=Candidatus Sungbacteria bacterium RIFCSPLOWO2_12_FULL_41_11 TaxID=1802286 RepID=A0A1G2LRB6_9BACT|nr:MAG: hypothetical protein A3D41_02330 [Candidatus Sungbacteria bacterium RIFCSPHIGHO2_02_FULL_41_12b]OHA14185.1 MAG: hypothetical protein A3G49_03010 [Candidatus Sungbacteria bacterium RIFCSPLOWO2_12_FULL_41_11]
MSSAFLLSVRGFGIRGGISYLSAKLKIKLWKLVSGTFLFKYLSISLKLSRLAPLFEVTSLRGTSAVLGEAGSEGGGFGEGGGIFFIHRAVL